MTKTIDIQKYVDEAIKKMLKPDVKGTNEIERLMSEYIREVMNKNISNTTDTLILDAFGIECTFDKWELRNPEKFAATKLGAYVFGPLQDLIVSRVKKVNVDAVVKKVERAIAKNLNEMTEQFINDALKSYIDEKLANHVDARLKTLMDEKLASMIWKSVDGIEQNKPEPKKRKLTKRVPKKPLLI
jgi:hypothetical protein